MKIGIGVDMGECLISAPMILILCSSAAWAKHEKCETVICPIWSGLRIWIIFCGRVLCNITRRDFHCEVDLEYELFSVVGYYAIVQEDMYTLKLIQNMIFFVVGYHAI